MHTTRRITVGGGLYFGGNFPDRRSLAAALPLRHGSFALPSTVPLATEGKPASQQLRGMLPLLSLALTLTLTITVSSRTAVGTAKGSVAASADANRDISCLHSVCSNDWRCVLAARAYASPIRPGGPNRTGWIQISDAIG